MLHHYKLFKYGEMLNCVTEATNNYIDAKLVSKDGGRCASHFDHSF